MNIVYKGFGIDYNIYGMNEYSVYVCGDDCIFYSVAEAKDFIDSIDNTECVNGY